MAISNSPRPSWRQTVVAAATRQATAEARHAWRVRPGVAPPFNYRLEHIRAVVAIVGDLAAKLAADDEVVTAAAWLHDVSKGFAEEPGDGHGLRGAERARAILRRTDFPRGKIEAVAGAISAHVGLFRDGPIEPIEAAILFDADKLSKMGAVSLVHFLCSFPATSASQREPSATERAAANLARWTDLVPRIVQGLCTEPARQMGLQRLALQRAFVEQLRAEGAA